MPRFIRVNNKANGGFVKLTGKPFQRTLSSVISKQSTSKKVDRQNRKRNLVTMQDNVLVYKPKSASGRDKNETACASSVIFLKPEIDRNLLTMSPSIDDTDSILQSLNS